MVIIELIIQISLHFFPFSFSSNSQVAPDTNETALQEGTQKSIDAILFNSTNTTGRRRRRLQANCTAPTNISLSVEVSSYGLTEAQIQQLLNSESQASLFGNEAAQVCAYTLESIIPAGVTFSPTTSPTARPCFFSCVGAYWKSRFDCIPQSIFTTKLVCIRDAKMAKRQCLYQAIKNFCFF